MAKEVQEEYSLEESQIEEKSFENNESSEHSPHDYFVVTNHNYENIDNKDVEYN